MTWERDKKGGRDGGAEDGARDEALPLERDMRRLAMRRRSIQRKAERSSTTTKGVDIPTDGGTHLAGATRERMEGALGTKLPTVRVFDGSASAEAARSLGARAFTDGQDIHFGRGQHAPGTPDGDRLLAHELTHVAQAQHSGSGAVHRKKADPGDGEQGETDALDVSQPGDAAEVEADQLADHATERLHGGGGEEKMEVEGAEQGAPRKASARLSGVGRKVYLTPDTGAHAAPQSPKAGAGSVGAGGPAGGAQGARGGPHAQPSPATGGAPPGADPAAKRSADAWPHVKAQLMRGEAPQVNMMPLTPGNASGIRRLAEIHADTNLPADVRAEFFGALAAAVGAMKEPPTDLHWLMYEITKKAPDKFLRRGKKLPADHAKNEMGGLRRALSLQWLALNCTDDVLMAANKVDHSIPPTRDLAIKQNIWAIAGQIASLIKAGKLPFDPRAHVVASTEIRGQAPGSSGWYFAAKDVPDGLPPPELRIALAAGPEYAVGYEIVELPPELAAPNDKGEGGASRPTALDLCLAPEGKLNPDQDEPCGRTDPGAMKPGQKDAREVVMPPVPLSSVKRGSLVIK